MISRIYSRKIIRKSLRRHMSSWKWRMFKIQDSCIFVINDESKPSDIFIQIPLVFVQVTIQVYSDVPLVSLVSSQQGHEDLEFQLQFDTNEDLLLWVKVIYVNINSSLYSFQLSFHRVSMKPFLKKRNCPMLLKVKPSQP